MFLDQAEFRAQRRQVVYMADWEAWLDKFLADQELPVLTHAGHIRSEDAKSYAKSQYELFHARHLTLEAKEDTLGELESRTAKLGGGKK
jgi:hypothetical protein